MIKLTLNNIEINYDDNLILDKISKNLKINKKYINKFILLKKSLDARKKPNIFYSLQLAVDIDKNIESKLNYPKFELSYERLNYKKLKSDTRPIVVGFGPSGMFCALALAKMGLRPIVFEQGADVEQRQKDVQNFWKNGKLNKYSNVQFGEGGAGTFSDGKLNTNLHNKYCNLVINEFYFHGAPNEILYQNKPHIGSDKLSNVVKNIREDIKSLGGEIFFNTKLIDIDVLEDKVQAITVLNVKTNEKEKISAEKLCLCLGHSARDTFELLYKLGMKISQKPFAMGVRIEQRAEDVNIMQYGKGYDKNLPNADYKLVAHLDNGRSIFTFCMCPGGSVVASSSDDGEIVTNGMSNFMRDNKYSNSALLVNIIPQDYESNHPLAGIYFQQKYEKLAYDLGGGDFSAPVQNVGSFLYDKKNFGKCTYLPKYKLASLKLCLPKIVYESLKEGLKVLCQKYNFAKDEDMLIGIESRSSCPLTLIRDDNFESSIHGIYTCGEGAGYAGGIVSSAVDGIKLAEKIYAGISCDCCSCS